MIGWITGLPTFTCCKRALVAAVIAYIAGTWFVKALNAILISAMVTNQMNQKEENNSGDRV
jgi:hypothetical protein